jgi:hypothetical protein
MLARSCICNPGESLRLQEHKAPPNPDEVPKGQGANVPGERMCSCVPLGLVLAASAFGVVA